MRTCILASSDDLRQCLSLGYDYCGMVIGHQIYICICFFVQDDILINLVIEQMINDTDPGMIILCLSLCVLLHL